MAELSDKEITEACARAMDLLTNVVPVYEPENGLWCYHDGAPDTTGFFYNPLTDRAQAMELVLKLPLQILDPLNGLGVWAVNCFRFVGRDTRIVAHAEDKDLLRAICLCAARVQIEKEKNANG